MPQVVSILQISDVHFGSDPVGGRLGLPAEIARVREEERRVAFTRALDLVEERELDGVLLPGDLFDDESIDTDTLRFVLHQLGRIAPRPVFLAPGNHDAFGGTSPYDPTAQDVARGLRWPENVVLFAHADFRTVSWPGRPGVTVTGCGVAANVPSAERRLAARIPRPDADLSFLLFHGSRDDGYWLQSAKATYPFSREELLAQGFTWTALGHYHGRQVLDDDAGRPLAAYSGCLFARRADETAPGGGLIVTVSEEETRVEPVEPDPRRIRRVTVDLTGAGFREEAVSRVDTALADTRPDDLVLLELTGRRARGLDLGFLPAVARRYFHLAWSMGGLRPDLDLDDLDPEGTVEERFLDRLKPLLEDDPDGTVRRAMLYGIDALERGRLEVRYEE